MIIEGRVHVFGDNISTDAIHPTSFFSTDPEQIKKGAMAGVRPDFYREVSEGDVIVAGRSFGMGSGREIAPLSLKLAGIGAVVAVSMPRIFYRNCINIGLLPVIADVTAMFRDGERIRIDTVAGLIENPDSGAKASFRSPEPELMRIIEAGGLMNTI